MSAPVDDGGPVSATLVAKNGDPITPEGGLSIRDWFAGMALQGALACPASSGKFADFASDSYQYADAMLAARKEQP